VVFVFGAVIGVVFGIALSFAVRIYRLKHSENPAYLGVVQSDDDEEVSESEAELKLSKQVRLLTFSSELTFVNIDAEIKHLMSKVDERGEDLESVILDMSQIRMMDATSTDKVLAFVSTLRERGLHVKIVRSFSMTNDSYTRYELRRIMGKVRPYPSVETAVAALIEEGDA
jgi:MFS superfamily sulfate permease-like transporter